MLEDVFIHSCNRLEFTQYVNCFSFSSDPFHEAGVVQFTPLGLVPTLVCSTQMVPRKCQLAAFRFQICLLFHLPFSLQL